MLNKSFELLNRFIFSLKIASEDFVPVSAASNFNQQLITESRSALCCTSDTLPTLNIQSQSIELVLVPKNRLKSCNVMPILRNST